MKKVFMTLLCLSVGALAVNAQNTNQPAANHPQTATNAPSVAPAPTTAPQAAPAPDPDAGEFKFKDKDNTHDYGEVPEGPLAEYDFEFKNVGNKPIVITEAHGSCGCTVPQWPHDPILPGKKGVIHVSYTTQGRQGMIMKDVTINSNAKQQPMVLHIRGTVKPKPAAPAATPAEQPVKK